MRHTDVFNCRINIEGANARLLAWRHAERTVVVPSSGGRSRHVGISISQKVRSKSLEMKVIIYLASPSLFPVPVRRGHRPAWIGLRDRRHFLPSSLPVDPDGVM